MMKINDFLHIKYFLRNLTLVFSECVLSYIDSDKVDELINYFN